MAADSSSPYLNASTAAYHITTALPQSFSRPRIAIICGSGLGALQHALRPERFEIAYRDIPHCPSPSVQGHEGKMVFGGMGGGEKGKRVPVVLLVGRVHYYEGHTIDLVAFLTRVCHKLGVSTLIVTNAAGSLRSSHKVGDIMLLHDHLNLAGLSGLSALIGPNDSAIGPRFPPLSDAYDLDLRRRAHPVWEGLRTDRKLHEGIYAYVAGPSYETRAEARFLSTFADAVGMSTVPEVLVARHAGMKVLAMSLITNKVVMEATMKGDDPRLKTMTPAEIEALPSLGRAGHEEVVREGREAADTVVKLIAGLIASIGEGET